MEMPIGYRVEDPRRVVCADGIIYVVEESKTTKIILNAEYDKPISLEEIAQKYPAVEIVMFEDFLEGKIFRYGNYAPHTWNFVGRTIGFA